MAATWSIVKLESEDVEGVNRLTVIHWAVQDGMPGVDENYPEAPGALRLLPARDAVPQTGVKGEFDWHPGEDAFPADPGYHADADNVNDNQAIAWVKASLGARVGDLESRLAQSKNSATFKGQ